MRKSNLKTVLFDFDGVLCRDRFYEKTLLPDYADVYDWIQENIFANHELVGKWMRGKVSSSDINLLIAANTGIDYKTLVTLYKESVRQMQLDQNLLDLAQLFRKSGVKVAIVTGNMDVFSQITVPNYKLNEKFDLIVNSADYKLNKDDENGKLFDIVMEELGADIKNSLLIDDSAKTINLFKRKGGQGHIYKNFEKLKIFLGEL
ncbi:MAG: HAD family hydrolase [Candidatus Berkelbacteria bacterium]